MPIRPTATPRRTPPPSACALIPLLVALGAAVGCRPGAGDAPPASGSVAGDVYLLRGEVVGLPHPDDPTSAFVLHHEAIDDFKGFEGEVWGMDAMTMPFRLAQGVSLAGIETGDKVEARLVVDWEGDPPQQITELHELPADTELTFRPARPPAEESGGS